MPWEALSWLQSSLKEATVTGMVKMQNSLKTLGFIHPFHIWQTEKTSWILDGHHRQQALIQLTSEGAKVPSLLPCLLIDCKDLTEARKMVLAYSSQYARVTEEGLANMMVEQAGLEADTLSELADALSIPFLDLGEVQESLSQAVPLKKPTKRELVATLYDAFHQECYQDKTEKFHTRGLDHWEVVGLYLIALGKITEVDLA